MSYKFLKTLLATVLTIHVLAAKADINLAWNAPTNMDANNPITNYTVYWGVTSGIYTFGAPAGLQTSLPITGLAPGTTYYFAVTATTQDGVETPDSNEVMVTNAMAMMPPALPVTPTNNPPSNPNPTNVAGGGGGGGGGVGFTGVLPTVSATTNVAGEISVPGIPPVLSLTIDSNHRPLLNISGTLGATMNIQTSSNLATLSSWSTFTNVAITNAGPTNQNPNLVNLAFPPGNLSYEVVDSAPATGEFYQVMMPYDYMVLADANLSGQSIPSRLLLVRMPGVPSSDVCYVTPESSFLYYDVTNRAFGVEPSGSTIRQIATTLSTWMGQNWTSASEFSYSNGVSSILATVVETEPAGQDPVAAAATPSIQIDF